MSHVARHGNARLEELAFISLVLRGDAYRNRLQALEARGWFEIRTLFAAVQRHSALGTLLEVEPFAQHGGTVVTSRSGHRLHHAGKPRAGDIQGGTGTLRPRTVFAIKCSVAGLRTVGVVIAPLPVLAIAFHRMLVGSLLCYSPRANSAAGVRWIQSGR